MVTSSVAWLATSSVRSRCLAAPRSIPTQAWLAQLPDGALAGLRTRGNKTVSMPLHLVQRTVKIWAPHQNLPQKATL
jgi:hypothetical protein